MPKIHVNGIHLFYDQKGKGDPLVLIPGLCCDSTLWQGISDTLAKHFQLILLDNRGVGKSDSPNIAYTIEHMADDILALIKSLGLNKPHVLGHSMGGGIAQVVAAKLNSNMGKLIISNSSPRMSTVGSLALKSNLHLHEDGLPIPRLVESIIPWIYSSEFLKDSANIQGLIEFQQKNPHKQSIVGHKRQYEALIKYDAGKWLKKISAHTLVISGEKDILSSQEDGLIISQNISKAHFIAMPDMGHAPMIEKPHDYAKLIVEFLQK